MSEEVAVEVASEVSEISLPVIIGVVGTAIGTFVAVKYGRKLVAKIKARRTVNELKVVK